MIRVFLTGFMGTGKTAVGRELARRMGEALIDIDTDVERVAGMSVADIFRRDGEARFRQLEREAIDRACGSAPAVIATGGGAVLDPVNRSRMHAAGRVVCLTAAPEVILRRVGSADTRPLLAGAPDPLRRIRELIAEREASYATADVHIDTSATTPPEIAERILEWLGR